MVIVMLLAMQIPTEMSKMLKRERTAQEERVPFLLGHHSYPAKERPPKTANTDKM